MNYPIERGALPVRAPETSSHKEALRLSRSPMEVIIADGVADAISGFRGGYISVVSVVNRCKAAGLRNVTAKAVTTCLEGMGYNSIGRAMRAYLQEDTQHRSELYSLLTNTTVDGYGRAQGYE
jgi:molybdate-binding protein